jgi:hypothetical protein
LGGRGDGGGRPSLSALLREKAPLFALALAASGVTLVVQRRSQYLMSLSMVPIPRRLANALVSPLIYLGKMFWPARLAFYPYPTSIPAWQWLGGGAALAALTAVALRAARKLPYLTVGWLWYLVTLAPVIGLVQVGSQARADRYAYLPSVGIFLALAWGLGDLAGRRPRAQPVLAGVCAGACAACLPLTGRQIGYWQDSVTLLRQLPRV